MNHIYRIVKNHKTGLWMVASEIARSAGSAASSTLVVGAVGLMLSGATGVQAADPPVPSAVLTITADSGEEVLENQATWTRPVCFDLTGSVQEGASSHPRVFLFGRLSFNQHPAGQGPRRTN